MTPQDETRKADATATPSSTANALKQNPSSDESSNQSVHLVVQRYRSCRVLVDETSWVSLGSTSSTGISNSNDDVGDSALPSHCGMLVYVSFSNTADSATIRQTAQNVLNLPVLTTGQWGDGVSPTCNLLQLAVQASGQASLVIVPQANLICKVKSQGKSIQYHGQIDKARGNELYNCFVQCIRAILLEEQYQNQQQALPDWYASWKQTNDPTSASASQSNTTPAAADPCTLTADIFKDPSRYASWDETGMPVTDAAGGPLTKSALKKLRKVRDAHAKRHEKWRAANPGLETRATTTFEVVDINATMNDTMTTNGAKAEGRKTQWESVPDASFCHVVAGTFGKRQGLEMQSDMGPFCHVLQA